MSGTRCRSRWPVRAPLGEPLRPRSRPTGMTTTMAADDAVMAEMNVTPFTDAGFVTS
jgi:hypothetical protein